MRRRRPRDGETHRFEPRGLTSSGRPRDGGCEREGTTGVVSRRFLDSGAPGAPPLEMTDSHHCCGVVL